MHFSIVIPSLNAGAYLERALRSVLDQAGSDTEIIVVDGGSTDGSVEIIQAMGTRWEGGGSSEVLKCESSEVLKCESSEVLTCGSAKVGGSANAIGANQGAKDNFRTLELSNSRTSLRWCSEPDGGQSHALNKGFARATGTYLLWINADDLLLPGTLARAREYLAAHPACEWLAGNLVYVDEQDRVLWCARDGQWRDRLYRHAPVRVYGPTSIFRRDLFERVGGFDVSLHYVMDTDLWLRFKAAGARFHRLDHYCWAFRVHGASKTSGDLAGRTDPRMAEEQRRMYAKNGLAVTRAGLLMQRGWRLLNGCYVRAWLDTRRYCGHTVAAMERVKRAWPQWRG